MIIRPETLIRWHRSGFRCYWRWKSGPSGGRPQIEAELRALIRRHLKPSPEAYIKAYDAHSALLTSLIRGSVASVRLW
jgi:hypothetical protein